MWTPRSHQFEHETKHHTKRVSCIFSLPLLSYLKMENDVFTVMNLGKIKVKYMNHVWHRVSTQSILVPILLYHLVMSDNSYHLEILLILKAFLLLATWIFSSNGLFLYDLC